MELSASKIPRIEVVDALRVICRHGNYFSA